CEAAPRLEALAMAGSQLDPLATKAVASLKSLRFLNVSGCSFERSGAEALSKADMLVTLDLSEARGLSAADFKAIAKGVQLEWLSVSSTDLDDQALGYLSNLENLQFLDCSSTAISDLQAASVGRLT